MASANLMHDAGHSKLVLWGNPQGWGGHMYYPWLIYINVWESHHNMVK